MKITLYFLKIICLRDKIDFDDINKKIKNHIKIISTNETYGILKLINTKIRIINLISIKLNRV